MEKRKEKQQQVFQRRLDVFMELYESKILENVSLDVDKADQIVRILDSAVIKLEGGTDFDLLALDDNPDEQKNKDSLFAIDSASSNKATPVESSKTNDEETKTEQMELGETTDSKEENSEESKLSEEPEEPVSSDIKELNEDSGDGELMDDGDDNSKQAPEDKKSENKPRPLHKTCSIFFRNISPSITRQEIEDVKKFYLIILIN